MASPVAAAKNRPDNPLAVDEDHESRRQLLQALELRPAARLNALRNTYSLYLIGQRRLGRVVFGEEI